MSQVTAGEKKLLGLGRYRFRERLSTSFFGVRFEVSFDGALAPSEPPAHADSGAFPASLHPRPDVPLAMRLVQVDTQLNIERLSRAVQGVRDLEHRAVIKPLQLVRSSTRLGVITPNLAGLTLSQLLEDLSARKHPIPPAAVVRIALDVLEGLEALRVHATAARRQEWLFGGLTPDSIFIGADGQSRLLDPGLAGAAVRQPQFANEAAVLAYTAPEQTGPDASFDVTSDVFSLGVMLWEMLTGRPLFGAETAAQTLENVHRAPIERVQRHQFVRGEPIAFALAQGVAQALRRVRTQRFENYDGFTTALMQAGPVASPDAVAELVKRSLARESLSDLKARIASVRAEMTTTPVTAPAINLHSLSLPPVRRQTDVSERPKPAPVASARPTPAVASAPAAQSAPAPLPPPSAAPVISARPRSSMLPLRLQEQLSAFPIGDLLRAPHRPRGSVWPLAAAAALVLGAGAWLLHGRSPEDRPAAVSGHAPSAPEPLQPPPDAPSVQVAPVAQPPAARPPAQAAPASAGKPAADSSSAGRGMTEPARTRAVSSGRRRGRNEPRRATPSEVPDLPEPAAESRPLAAPPEPEPAPAPAKGKFIPEDI